MALQDKRGQNNFPLLCTFQSYCPDSEITVPLRDNVYTHYPSGASGRRVSNPGDGKRLFLFKDYVIIKQSDIFFIESK